jgi:hypothetical protein
VSEVRLAHFRHRWEAEFARGFLSDGEIPSRLAEDGAVGSGLYTGDLAGTSLFVTVEDEAQAREILEAAGVLESAEAASNRPPPLTERDLPPVLRADAEDLTERLDAARRAETRHGIYALLGFTPAAVIPLVGLFLEGNMELLALLFVLIVALEGGKWIRAGKEVQRLEILLAELEEEADAEEDGLLPDGGVEAQG